MGAPNLPFRVGQRVDLANLDGGLSHKVVVAGDVSAWDCVKTLDVAEGSHTSGGFDRIGCGRC